MRDWIPLAPLFPYSKCLFPLAASEIFSVCPQIFNMMCWGYEGLYLFCLGSLILDLWFGGFNHIWGNVSQHLLKFFSASFSFPFLLWSNYMHIVVAVQSLNHVQLFVTPRTAARQASLFITISQSCSNSCPLSQWCHPTISSSVASFSSCLQSFPASRSFPMSWFFSSGGQSTETSTSASVLPINIQGWFPLGLTGLISLQSKGLSVVFSSTFRKHQFFGT